MINILSKIPSASNVIDASGLFVAASVRAMRVQVCPITTWGTEAQIDDLCDALDAFNLSRSLAPVD